MSIRVFKQRAVMMKSVVTVLCALLAADATILAQATQSQTQTKPQTPPATGTSTSDKPAETKLSKDELDSLVAPIALYPDPLLAQALAASTYPLELVQAQQWVAKNSKLKPEELKKEVEKQKWDPSVMATAVVPDLLKRLTEDITWTDKLGNAFLDQQADVMDAVQRLRAKAKDSGKLASGEQQKVETKVVESKTIIEIQPTSTEVVYVPTYSPTVIWGPPVYPYYPYPPIYYPPYTPGAAWIGFGVGMMVGIGMSGGWGWGCGWGGNNIYINNNNNFNRVNHNNINTGNINTGNINRGGNSNWSHDSSHRGGAPYANQSTADRFGGSSRTGTGANRTGTNATGANRTGTGATGANRSGASTMSAGGAGGDRVGSRSVPSTSSRSGSGSAMGTSGGASRAGSASSRGGSSMGSRGGGGGGGRR